MRCYIIYSLFLISIIGFLALFNCQAETSNELSGEEIKILQNLSEYGLDLSFAENQKNNKGFSYTLNTPLFSDYAKKERILFIPSGFKMKYSGDKEFDFPVGSIIAKTFLVPEGFSRLDGNKSKRLETRLLIHNPSGWYAVSYVWENDGKEAKVAYAGENIPMRTSSGENFTYSVPSRNQCASCHQNYEGKKQTIVPIGIKAKHLNHSKQLEEMKEKGILSGLPLWGIPKLPRADDSSETIERRARAYLDINCAHCHNKNAAAGMNSQLVLSYEEDDIGKLGFCKTPGSAGKGGGGLRYDIVPGKPDESILFYRTKTQDPGAMMPQIGRALSHKEGVELLKEWILSLEGKECP